MSLNKPLYPTINLGHEAHAWYDRHREFHAAMGVQVYTEMSQMRTSLRDSSTRYYVHRPIGNRTMENLAWDTGKRSCQPPYTTRTHKIPAFKATGVENKDTKEGTQNDGTRSAGITGCTR
jgi:hypothetical protein